jgi:putative DNA primase/helicase
VTDTDETSSVDDLSEIFAAVRNSDGDRSTLPGSKSKRSRTAKKREPRMQMLPSEKTGDEWTNIREDKGRTDRANSRRFLKRYRENVRFCHAWKSWLIWDGTRWRIDNDGAVMRLAMDVADSVWFDAAGCRTKDVVDFAVSTSGTSKLKSMLTLAAADVPISVDDLDRNPWLLNCTNGTIDLRTGELRPHRREDCITKLCPTRFDQDAGSYCWDRFHESIFDDQPTIDFLQRFAGYSLTGSVSEQVLAVFWGVGSNGKSTWLTAFQDTLGTDYSMAAPSGLLTVKKNDSHPTELADLFGMRFVVSQETEDGNRLAESLVKSLTGGDRIRARRMKENFWQFSPSHKIVICTNHRPRVKGTDHAMWRRLVLVPFLKTFWNPDKGETGPDELMQDKDLPAKLKAESEGILAWAVRGCLEWQRNGLQIPETVRAATEDYRCEQDVLGRFVNECCLTGQAYRVKFSSLFESLEAYCNDNGDNLPSRKFVGMYLKDKGFEDQHSGTRWYLGIALKASN